MTRLNWIYSAFLIVAFGCLTSPVNAATLLHHWTFNGNTSDIVGGAEGSLGGGAAIVGGRLSLDGIDDQMLTLPTSSSISERTLVSWVSLNNLAQGGGGALSIQAGGGGGAGGFDGIVYNELGGSRWMAGSNGFSRTQNPQVYGSAETVTDPGSVMIAITYANDNSINLYRNGALYGSYTKGSLQTYNANTADFIFGRRHDGAGNPLNAFIDEARVYSGAMTSTEIADLYAAGTVAQSPNTGLVHRWTFDANGNDLVGSANITAFNGNAQIARGRLVLDGAGDYATSSTLDQTLGARTIMVWANLNSLGGGAGSSPLGIQSAPGVDNFDSIVYQERQAGQWMNGSNGWTRSVNDNGGAAETTTSEVMLAITYGLDNSIKIYRNGVLYNTLNADQGSLITRAGLDQAGGQAFAIFGRRVSLAGPEFNGSVNEARVYNYALSPAEIQNAFNQGIAPAAGSLAHQWTFNVDGQDQVGTADGTLFGNAAISGGQLHLDGNGDYMRTSPIDNTITNKTLVAWVSLDNLTQGAGGVLTLEDPTGGDTFDSIVYNEQGGQQWMAGSNGFQRTNVAGASETSLNEVMIAISYGPGGKIEIYRDGELYHEYTTGGPISYTAGLADVLLGLRHENAGGTPFLAGSINEARIYNYNLSAGEVRYLFNVGPVPVPEPGAALLSALGAIIVAGLRRRNR